MQEECWKRGSGGFPTGVSFFMPRTGLSFRSLKVLRVIRWRSFVGPLSLRPPKMRAPLYFLIDVEGVIV